MIPVVVGILKFENKFLVGQRSLGKPYSGYWEFPGGKIEENESANDALIRELREELGIEVLVAKPLFKHTHVYPDKTVLLDLWLVEKFAGMPHHKEHQTLRWVTFNELLNLRLLEGNLSIMDKIKTSCTLNLCKDKI
jgi:8-oxo-dGTP diphosphatase